MTSPPGDEAATLHRARVLCDLQRFDEASLLLGRMVAANPHDATTWSVMARAQLGLGNADASLHAAGTAIGLAPEREWPHRLASIALGQLYRREESLFEARQAVRLAPNNWQPHVRLAWALISGPSGPIEREEAGWVAARALTLGPHQPDAHVAVGAVAAAQRQKRQAEEAFRAALALDPQNVAAHNELARLHLRRRSMANAAGLADAAAGFATAVQADPRADVSRRNLDIVLRVFLARAAYLLFLGAYLGVRATSQFSGTAWRLAPLLLLAVIGAYVASFLRRLPPPLRRVLWGVVRAGWVRLAVAAEGLAVLCIAAGMVSPQPSRPGLAIAAAVAAIVGRLVLLVEQGRMARVAKRTGSGTGRAPGRSRRSR